MTTRNGLPDFTTRSGPVRVFWTPPWWRRFRAARFVAGDAENIPYRQVVEQNWADGNKLGEARGLDKLAGVLNVPLTRPKCARPGRNAGHL